MTGLTLQGPPSVEGLAEVQGVGDRLLGALITRAGARRRPTGKKELSPLPAPSPPSKWMFAGWRIWASQITLCGQLLPLGEFLGFVFKYNLFYFKYLF